MKGSGILALIILAGAWCGPLPRAVADSFSAHMVLHMAVVGFGVPLLAVSLRHWAGRHLPNGLALPLIVSLADLVIVWGWHAPAFHEAARSNGWAMAAEQASFFTVSLLVWLLAVADRGGESALAGAMSLFFTSMHMTLLGALIALSARDLYPALTEHSGHHSVVDQQIGGAIMLAIGGIIYLGGALALVGRQLRGADAG